MATRSEMLAILLLSLFCSRGEAATTDPDEVNALNSIFDKWKISSSMSKTPWNTTGDPCTGIALSGDYICDSKDPQVCNPGIICDCTFNDGSTCHITRLKARDLGIVGNIPEELQSFKYLKNLELMNNHLSGPLPEFIGNFSQMEWLTLSKNLLSGPIPKELGRLQNLKSLGLGLNNFSGSLPAELGNLTNLLKMYIDSTGVTGEIPSTFGNLQRLTILLASDNNFGGKIPGFIGNFTDLDTLRLQGNSFKGPIPLSFSNLTKLTQLRLGNLLNETSSLEFIKNLKNLSILILRDCNIVDTIPSDIKDYTYLKYLDLSFNGLTGLLPSAVFNLESLEYLFLGNNNMSGNLPAQKSTKLRNIDLSYNNLSGDLPSWSSEDNLKLNLVANNFIFDDSNKDLHCLQHNFPCFRGSPVYSSFAVNCGGHQIDTSGTHYDADEANLSTASYYVSDDKRWAVSSTGYFMGADNPKYVAFNPVRFSGTSDQELYQSARLSPSSLRYYGLALENGNYTVTLNFAETAFSDDPGQLTVGKRIFDIYIQGILVQKDFDIRKVAGRSYAAVVKNYTATVTDNHLEVHLFWAEKGSCCFPTTGYYGPSISAISINPDFKPTVSNHLPHNSMKNKVLIAGISAATVFVIMFLAGIWLWKFKIRHACETKDPVLSGLTALPCAFNYLELKNATEDFSPANKLGEGGFGCVFKGKLADGKVVAVKDLTLSSLQGKQQFVAEIDTISAVKHRNLVKLYGCCYEGEKRLLVYEYMENSSLDKALFGKSILQLDWTARFMICLGSAKGIAYLHEESRPRIIHRDIKASNILLDADLSPKISDFGLARLFDEKNSHITTRVAGTFGYLAPEYAMRGHLTEKADVFSFGVLALEILCGRPNKDPSYGAEMYLLEWAWQLHENKHELDMVDPRLASFNAEEAFRVIGVAFLCTQTNPSERPPMSRVVAMLIGDLDIPDVLEKPYYVTDGDFEDRSSQLDSRSTGLTFSPPSSPLPMLAGKKAW